MMGAVVNQVQSDFSDSQQKDIESGILRDQFPIFADPKNQNLAYLDTAASAQKPKCVIDAVSHYYAHDCANIHRGAYRLSMSATDAYEASRQKVASLINAPAAKNIVFTRNATESINLVASSYVANTLSAGDVVLVTAVEHHANLVPWQLLKDRGIEIRVVPVDETLTVDLEAFEAAFDERVKFAALSAVSNAVGSANPIYEMVKIAHRHNVPVLVDGAQQIVHAGVDVTALDADFYVFSAHKLYAPTGVGVLYGKYDLLEKMPPYQGGGDMIARVEYEASTYQAAPAKFEAGTPDIAGVIGLGAACDFVAEIGYERIQAHERALRDYAFSALKTIPGIRIFGADKNGDLPDSHTGILSFTLEDVHAHDISTFLDQDNVAIRAGHHCAMPLMKHLGVAATARISVGLYNHKADIDQAVQSLKKTQAFFTQG